MKDKFLKERINNIEKVKILMKNGKSSKEACNEVYETYLKDHPWWKEVFIYDPYAPANSVILWICYICFVITLICGFTSIVMI